MQNLGLTLQRFLIYSYAYYFLDIGLVPDEEYDQMAKTLLENWDNFEHRHKSLITKEDLKAGTLYALKRKDYPGIVRGSAEYQCKLKNAMVAVVTS